MLGGGTIRALRPPIAAVLTVLLAAVAVVCTTAPGVAGAAVAARPLAADTWTERFCTGLVGWQAAALDARDLAYPLVRTPPVGKAAVKTAALGLDAALKPPTKAIQQLAENLERRTPKGKRGAEVGAALATGVGRLADTYAAARDDAVGLKTLSPAKFTTRAPRVLTKLDADLTRAAKPITKLERKVEKSIVSGMISSTAACRRVGFEWEMLGDSVGAGPAPVEIDPASPGADDQTAPAVLLPACYRPTPDIAALATRTSMSGLGRTYFYGGEPLVSTGATFVANCPSAEAGSQQILGCFRDHHIYVLNVTRPDLATVVDVTAAHEMLHAVYEDMTTDDRALIDPQLSAFYDASTDAHLRQIVGAYERRAPLSRPNELHSIIGSQVGTLTPELDEYYGRFFRNRPQVVAAFDAYISVFDNLLNRYHELDAQLGELRDRINGLRDQSNAAGTEAQRLSGQIDALRSQGRIGESNALVGPQNDAARRANGLAAQGNALIGDYNAVVSEINGIAAELSGLDRALRPLG